MGGLAALALLFVSPIFLFEAIKDKDREATIAILKVWAAIATIVLATIYAPWLWTYVAYAGIGLVILIVIAVIRDNLQ